MRLKLAGVMLAAMVLPLGGNAFAATHLECMDEPYTAAENAAAERFYAGFTMAKWAQEGPGGEVADAIRNRAATCAQRYGWSTDAQVQAQLNRAIKLFGAALDRKAPFSARQLADLKKEIKAVDQAQLRRVIEPSVMAGMQGTEAPGVTPADDAFVEGIITRSGIPTTSTNVEFAGGFMAYRVMKASTAEHFAAK